MLAMVLDEPQRIEESPLKQRQGMNLVPAPDQLVIRVNACAVCRTDLQLVEGDLRARRLPIVPGHQATGIVESLGSAVPGWSVGQRAGVAWLGGACGICSYCAASRENLCGQAIFTGWDQDGGYAQQIAVNANFALPLPEGFGDVEAAPLLCGGVIGYRSLRIAGVEPGCRVGLYGYGASARLAIQVARHWGCEVFVCTRSKKEQDSARQAGARWAGNYDQLPPVDIDAAVTFAPSGDVVMAALKALARGGTVAINAIHLDLVPQFSYEHLWWERSLRSVANFTRRDAQEFLSLAAEIPIRTETDVMRLEQANEALRRLSTGDVHGTIVLTTA